MTSQEIRKRFLSFFEKRGHAIIPSAPLVPANDPSVLFNTAGMQPLVPYLLGQDHPKGKRLANVQKCVRTVDIEEIGDDTHHTFFEMLGNWSLGDYFKKESIAWSYELLTSKEEGFGLDPNRLYVTVFEGDENAPKDEESIEIWKSLGIPEHRIYTMPADKNWWSPGPNGPCGPDTEIFYDVTEHGLGDMSKEEYKEADDRQEVVEIWNNVFMEYEKKDDKVIGKLPQKNVDTGAGFERFIRVIQGVTSNYDTDLFAPLMNKISSGASSDNAKAKRIVADHIRTVVMMISDGVLPSNTDRGYILRRLLRRAVRYSDTLGLPEGFLQKLVDSVVELYKDVYPEVSEKATTAKDEIQKEEEKFRRTLGAGMRELEKLIKLEKVDDTISGHHAFWLFTTYGFPIEFTEEIAKEKGLKVDRKHFEIEMKTHKDLSREGAEHKFKGGLADANEQTVKLHTAHHLLLAALQEVLGSKDIKQRGSNITAERLRIDFAFDRKLTSEELKKVEDLVNKKIQAGLDVVKKIMPREEAEQLGAEMEFGAKYPDTVSVYCIVDAEGNMFSKEFCGGPHVENTRELGHFKIQKEEASSAGVRRIKAILE